MRRSHFLEMQRLRLHSVSMHIRGYFSLVTVHYAQTITFIVQLLAESPEISDGPKQDKK